MTDSGLDTAILKTLKYSDHFNFPLTKAEIFTRLVSIKTTPKKLSAALDTLLRQHTISTSQDFYFLPNRRSLVNSRLTNLSHSQKDCKRAQKLAKLLALFPSVLAIFITGSLAVNNSTQNDDIDLMIITKSGQLWTTRFLLTLLVSLLFLRRTPKSRSHKGKLCLNLYLTPNSLYIPKSKHSLYSAYELIQAVPLYDPVGTHAALLTANSWITNFLPNFVLPTYHTTRSLDNRKTGALEYLLYYLQLTYMRRKITREYITLNSAFFHPDNPSPKV